MMTARSEFVGIVVAEWKEDADFSGSVRAEKSFRSYADNRKRFSIHRNCFSDDGGISAEATLPIWIADDDGGRRGRFIRLAGKNQRSKSGLQTERGEKIRGDIISEHTIAAIIGSHADKIHVIRGHFRKRVRVGAVILKVHEGWAVRIEIPGMSDGDDLEI